ncbi:hypothetical protein N752_05465 [Desulforamulus aquiferis]|nr:hypothetical protein [Desulforamulus aquiferis]RYD06342.1 hypothetical protein N752_05465 [Desulforamulus aquiferis]
MLKGIRQRTIGNYGLLLAIFVGFFLLHYQGYVSLWVVLIGSSLATGIAAWLTAQRLIAPVEQITQIAQDMPVESWTMRYVWRARGNWTTWPGV